MKRIPYIHRNEHDIYCRAEKPLIPIIAEALKYERTVQKQTQYGTRLVRKPAYYIDRKNGLFLAGLLPRVQSYLDDLHITYAITAAPDSYVKLGDPQPPALQSITLRSDQRRLIDAATTHYRGVIVSPTGSGKTITALGILSVWPQARALVLAHRKDIVQQFYNRMCLHLPKRSVQLVGAGKKEPLQASIVCSTIQSIIKYPITETERVFGIIICDEAHHVCDRDSQYGLFLQTTVAPVKIGFTATCPQGQDKLLALEGLIGPTIGEITLDEGQTMGMIAHPYVTLIPIPFSPSIGDLKKYRDIYSKGIAENTVRSARIIKHAKLRAKGNKTSLIIISELAHGAQLQALADRLGLRALWVHGATKQAERNTIKQALDARQVDSVICTDVWREGIDIPSVNVVIVAGGGKSPVQLLQGIGRGMRCSEGKSTVEIVDCLDPYRYLAEHTIRRLSVYAENGWLTAANTFA